eukprot:TRINITY_DN2348_c0_g1_i1.p1 TRINITY_DN2348_c0_g1~~TRINITY_DN2348_c0_g1_i1.p1  ORF type:complete len:1288 (+),score=272.94 TRINITY_DN2348_c0_g1_i1:78-3866(+)
MHALVLASTALLPSAGVPLRIVLQQATNMVSRQGRFNNQCSNVTDEGCWGGHADLNALVRELGRGADDVVKIFGHDWGDVNIFHRDGWSINNHAWRRLGAHAAVLGHYDPVTQETQLMETLRWLSSAPVPVVNTNFPFSTPHRMSYYRDISRDAIVSAGRWKVGIIGLWGPHNSFLPLEPDLVVEAVARNLRFHGADVIIGICLGFPAYWAPHEWDSLAQYDLDVLIPPSCNDLTACTPEDGSLRKENGTWVVPNVDSGLGLTTAKSVCTIDFYLDASGRLQPDVVRNISLQELHPSLRETAQWKLDSLWEQDLVDVASSNDPVVAVALDTMPDGTPDRSMGNPAFGDHPCRRDLCPLGVFLNSMLRKAFPDVDIIIQNGGGMRSGWDPGNITTRMVYGASPFQNYLCAFETTGPDIWRLFERFAQSPTATGAYNSSFPNRGGFPQPDGLAWEIDLSRPGPERLVRLDVMNRETGEWEPLHRQRMYTLVLNSYNCGGGDKYVFRKQNLRTVGGDLQQLLVDMIRKHSPHRTPQVKSIQVFGDTRETFRLPELTASDCGPKQRFLPEWGDCTDCPEGMEQSAISPEECIFPPSDSAITTWVLVVIVAGAITLAALVAAPLAWRATKEGRERRRLFDNNRIAEEAAEKIALMRLHELDWLYEVQRPNRIQASFINIVNNLKQYRPYLPESLLVYEDEDEECKRRVEPPRGCVALCFTDIVGSTRMWNASPDGMEVALDVHNREIRACLDEFNGYEVKTIGDSFMCAFEDPVAAVCFGVRVQESLCDATWPDVPAFSRIAPHWLPQKDPRDPSGPNLWGGIAVRIGVAYGEVKDERNPLTDRMDYRGNAVNLAARCESSAPIGVVHVTAELAEQVRKDRRTAGLHFVTLPEVEMKGIGKIGTTAVCSKRLRSRLDHPPHPHRESIRRVSILNPLDAESQGRRSPSRVTQLASAEEHETLSGRCSDHPDDTATLHSAASAMSQSTEMSGISDKRRQTAVPVGKRLETQLSLNSGLGSVAVVSLLNVLGGALISSEAGRIINDALSRTAAEVKRSGGRLWIVVGHTIHVTWNLTSTCPKHKHSALAFVGFVTTALPQSVVGAANGPLVHGNVGTLQQRFNTVCGQPQVLSELLVKRCHELGAKALLAYIPSTPDELQSLLRPVDVWGSSSGDLHIVVEERVVEERADGPTGETQAWSGELGDSLTDRGPYDIRAAFFDALLRGSSEALDRLRTAAAGDRVLSRVVVELDRHLQDNPDGAQHRIGVAM